MKIMPSLEKVSDVIFKDSELLDLMENHHQLPHQLKEEQLLAREPRWAPP